MDFLPSLACLLFRFTANIAEAHVRKADKIQSQHCQRRFFSIYCPMHVVQITVSLWLHTRNADTKEILQKSTRHLLLNQKWSAHREQQLTWVRKKWRLYLFQALLNIAPHWRCRYFLLFFLLFYFFWFLFSQSSSLQGRKPHHPIITLHIALPLLFSGDVLVKDKHSQGFKMDKLKASMDKLNVYKEMKKCASRCFQVWGRAIPKHNTNSASTKTWKCKLRSGNKIPRPNT